MPPLLAALNDVVSNLRKPMLDRLTELEIDRAPYIEGILQLRERHEAIMAGFQRELDLAWGNGPEPSHDDRHYGSNALADNADNMELVGEDELDARLATDHFADAIAREWKPQLLSLNGYLAWLDLTLHIGATKGPHSPQRVAMAVYGAFAASGLSGKVRTLAIHCGQAEFVELMGPIYESLHARLIRHLGPQDNFSPRARRQTEIPSSETESPAPEPDWLTRFFVSWENQEAPATSAAAPSADGQAVATLPQELHQMLEQSRNARHRGDASLAPRDDQRRTLSHGELVAAMTLLQIAPRETHEAILDAPGGVADGIKEQIFKEARKLGTDSGNASPSEADKNVLDLVGMLFEVIFKESHLTRGQRLTLCQLIAPMAQVALEDRKLFLQSSHPARRLLNALVEASEANTGETDAQQALLEKVDDVVRQLVASFDGSQSVFRAARADFMGFYRHYQDAAEQAESVAAEGVRTSEVQAQALAQARDVLAARLEGIALPAPLRQAVESGWPAHAARMAMAKRPQSAGMLLDGFMQALDDTGQAGDGGKDWAAAVNWLQPVWMGAGLGQQEVALIKQDLLASIDPGETESEPLVAAPAERPMQSAQDVQDSGQAPGENLLKPDQREEGLARQDNVTAAYFRQLQLGSWLDFIDRNNRVQPGKLSYVSPVSARLMFVNRGGGRICVVSVEELVAMSSFGRVRMHRDEDAFYSAMQAVVDKLAMQA